MKLRSSRVVTLAKLPDASSAGALAKIPDACILTALLFLDVHDALRFRRACRRFNLLLRQNEYWLPRLCIDFGLQLQVGSGNPL